MAPSSLHRLPQSLSYKASCGPHFPSFIDLGLGFSELELKETGEGAILRASHRSSYSQCYLEWKIDLLKNFTQSLSLSKLELTPGAKDQQNNSNDSDGYDLNHEDWSLLDGFDDELEESSDLDREWQRRHDQFHTIGYRDGLMAGKEASSQEGFNIGFKESVLAGYRWGLVRGVTSAVAYLPEELKEKLVEAHDKRNHLQGLYESVHLLSTSDALKSFYEDFQVKGTSEPSDTVEVIQKKADLQEETSDCSHLGSYFGQLRSLIRENSAIEMHLPDPK